MLLILATAQLAWTLRQSEQVTVLERQNALHFDPTSIEALKKNETRKPRQNATLQSSTSGGPAKKHALPATNQWLKPNGKIISLVKPHYEADKKIISKTKTNKKCILSIEQSQEIFQEVLAIIPDYGF